MLASYVSRCYLSLCFSIRSALIIGIVLFLIWRLCVLCCHLTSSQMVDERDKGDKLWELLTKLHENPPKADHGKTVRTNVKRIKRLLHKSADCI